MASWKNLSSHRRFIGHEEDLRTERSNVVRNLILALFLVILFFAVVLLIALDNIMFRFYADVSNLIGMFENISAKEIMTKILWLLELLLCGVLIILTLVWGHQSTMQFIKSQASLNRNGDDPAMRYLLASRPRKFLRRVHFVFIPA
jgi:hypothetical protein